MIREYKESDMDSIIDIWLQASILAHSFIDKAYWESKADDMRNIYIPASNTFVYADGVSGEVEGFVSLVDNYIAAIFVQPHQQGKGIGKQLIAHAKSLHTELVLGVYSENKDSIAFYLKQGFVLGEEKIEEGTGHKEYAMCYQAVSI